MDELLNESCRETSCSDQPCDCSRPQSLAEAVSSGTINIAGIGSCNTAIGYSNTNLGYASSGTAMASAQGTLRTENAPIKRQARDIEIKPLNYGYLVIIGCQRFAIEDPAKLTKMLELYLKDHEKVEKEWMSNDKLPE